MGSLLHVPGEMNTGNDIETDERTDSRAGPKADLITCVHWLTNRKKGALWLWGQPCPQQKWRSLEAKCPGNPQEALEIVSRLRKA